MTVLYPSAYPDQPALAATFLSSAACGHSKKKSFSSSICSLSVHRIKPELSDAMVESLLRGNTPDVMEGGCEIYPPPAASELALPSDNSKHDSTGGKFILVPEYLTERDV